MAPDEWRPHAIHGQPTRPRRPRSVAPQGQAGTRWSGVLAPGPSSTPPNVSWQPSTGPGSLACSPSQRRSPHRHRSRLGCAGLSVEWWAHSLQRVGDAGIPGVRWWKGVAAMSKYAVFFTLKGEAIARAMEQPSDRVMVVSKAVESAGGTLEAYYLMFGQYDGFVIVDLPDSRAAAATSLAVSSTGAFEHLETHELIEAEDLNPILEQAKDITSQLPGT